MLLLPKKLLEQIQSHAERAYPEEGAGVLLGRPLAEGRLGTQVRPLANTFDPDQRSRRYMIDPLEMLQLEDEAESLGLELIGIFHSHPDHPAQPSEFDRQRALPWYSYLITSVAAGRAVETLSWRLNEARQFEPEQIRILEDASEANP